MQRTIIHLWAGMALCLVSALSFPPVSGDTPLANEEWRTTLGFDLSLLGLDTLVDIEASVGLEAKRVEIQTEVDGLVSLGQHVVNVPVEFQISYEAGKAKGGETMRLYIQAATYEHAGLPLQLYKQGFEMGASLEARVKGIWGFSDWRGVSWGVDLGFDFEGYASPPMAGEKHLDRDTIDTPITVPPPPSSFLIPTLAEDALGFGSRLLDGRIEAIIRLENVDPVDPHVKLRDCNGNLLSSFTLTWNGRHEKHCIALEIDPFIQSGQVAEFSLSEVSYTVDNEAVFSIVPSILGWSPGDFPIGSLAVAPITADSEDSHIFEFDLEPSIEVNLVANYLAMSRPPGQIEYDVDHYVTGYVLNYGDPDEPNSDMPQAGDLPFQAQLAISPASQNNWVLLKEITIDAIAAGEVIPFTAHLARGRFLPGAYDIRLLVDPADTVAEFNSSDNQKIIPVLIRDVEPDLRVIAGTQGPVGCANQAFELRAQVENWGRASLASDATMVLFEAHPIPDSGAQTTTVWTVLGSAPLDALAGGERGIASLSVPAGTLASGRYAIRATVNPNGTEKEDKLFNNDLVTGAIYLRPTEPDLFIGPNDIHFTYSDPRLNPGDPPDLDTEITVWSTIRNTSCSRATDIDVQFFSLQQNDVKIPIGSQTISRLDSGANSVVSTSFIPSSTDATALEGQWGVETVITPLPNELNAEGNSSINAIYVGTALGNINGSVFESWSNPAIPISGAQVKVFEGGALVAQEFSGLDGSFSLTDLPTGFLSITVEKPTYQSHSRQIELAFDETREIRVSLDFIPQHPDLVGAAVRWSQLNNSVEICIRNIGNVPATGPIRVDFFLSKALFENVFIDGPVGVGAVECVIMPNVVLPPQTDWVGGIVIDPGKTLPELSDDNNQYDTIITNPKPEVTIDSVNPNPAVFGTPVNLQASASDDDGIRRFEWRSDRDGLIATSEDVAEALLSTGIHKLTFRACDQHGECAEVESANVEIKDGTGPDIELLYSTGEQLMRPATAIFQWIASDDVSPESALQYANYLQGRDSGFGAYSSARQVIYEDLQRGTYTLHLKSIDEAGNESESLSLDFKVVSPESGRKGGGAAGLDLALLMLVFAILGGMRAHGGGSICPGIPRKYLQKFKD